SRHVIAKDFLEVIWEDSKNTILPSWIDAPPHNWGTKSAGKLSADEWKVVCSISLVITLIRVWGYKYQHDPQSRHYQLLLNFLDMVHAIQLLNLHETSSQIRQDYHSLILKYLRTVLVLFPDVSLKPNHHYAIHIAEDLELMGPVHAHNTPVFERTNHTLQELNSNKHLGIQRLIDLYVVLGEVEATMLKVYCQQGNLEMMLAHCPDDKDDIQEALDALLEIKRESHRGMFAGTDLSSWSSPDRKFKSSPIIMDSSTLDQIIELLCVEYQVPHSTWEGALTRDALLLARVAHDGVVFSPKTRENSIVFKKLDEGGYGAGTVQRIISHRHRHPARQTSEAVTYLEVLDMNSIDDIEDLYRRLKCGWLCSQLPGRRRLVPLPNVVSHFVRTNLIIQDTPVTHVYPMPRVRASFGHGQ
ncbi:hypothetical protein F5877DRAFT_55068, partial [Lentinula edodes]